MLTLSVGGGRSWLFPRRPQFAERAGPSCSRCDRYHQTIATPFHWTHEPRTTHHARTKHQALDSVAGFLIAFEGLDQSGKQTQAELLRDRLIEEGRLVRLLSFPAYDTPIGAEIERALRGARDYAPDVMQLLYVANRYEWKPRIEQERARGTILLCDRYLSSSIAYGEAQGLDASWLGEIQRHLPQPDLTCLLDIAPEVSAERKTADRDRYERDLALLGRVRDSYLRQAQAPGWLCLDANRDRAAVAADIYTAVEPRLQRSSAATRRDQGPAAP